MKKLFKVALLLLFMSGSAYAACSGSDPMWTAATIPDIQDCHDNNASNGDFITYTGASVAVTAQVNITKSVTITRADDCTRDGNNRVTSCPVVLTNNVADGAGSIFLVTLSTADLVTTIENFELAHGSSDAAFGHIYFLGENDDDRRFVVQSIKCANSAGDATDNCFRFNRAYGVVANSTLLTNGNVGVGHVFGGQAGSCGHQNWAAGAQLGTDQYVYFDNVTITGAGTNGLIDSHSGGRYVVRFSTVAAGSLNNHGVAGSCERGGMAYEIYNNLLDQVGPGLSFHSQGTGVHLYFGNWMALADATPFISVPYRMAESAPTYGAADGRNQWDLNDDANNPYDTGTVTSTGTNSITDSANNFSGLGGYAVRKTGGPSVKTCTQLAQVTGSTYRATCNGHGIPNGEYVSIYGDALNTGNLSAYASSFHLVSNTQTNTFDFVLNDLAGQPATVSSGEILATIGMWTGHITTHNGTTLTYTSAIHPLFGGTMVWEVGDTFEVNKVLHTMDGNGRTGGSLVTTDVLSSPPAGWNDQTTLGDGQWSNRKCPSSPPTASCASATAVNFGYSQHFIENLHFYNEDTTFDGTTGVGVGVIGSIPGTCTTGVFYWATDEGEWDSTNGATADGRLYKCTATDTWTLSFTPYTYPHPLVDGGGGGGTGGNPATAGGTAVGTNAVN